ncbi:hypothetical protein SFUMM280S_01384 [Streptomyces fumanus]
MALHVGAGEERAVDRSDRLEPLGRRVARRQQRLRPGRDGPARVHRPGGPGARPGPGLAGGGTAVSSAAGAVARPS